MGRPDRILRLAFASPDAFRREYSTNLANAGAFVSTDEPFELREPITVDVVLEFCNQSVSLDGEVVHLIPKEMAQAGGTPGVAVQFAAPAHEVCELLAPLVHACGSFQPEPKDRGRRSAPRVPARVPARLMGAADGGVEAQTRNLSRSGVLLAVPPKTSVKVGEPILVALTHPKTGETMELPGTVIREVRSEGQVSALAVRFEPEQDRSEEVKQFLDDIQSAEHTRRLGGISGPLSELGPQNLIQMFGNTASAGTLIVRNRERECIVVFQGGLLLSARLGRATGIDALVRLFTWRDGAFEFHAGVETVEDGEAPLPLEAAILEAACQADEQARDREPLRDDVPLRVTPAGDSEEPDTKTEAAVLDLARAGFTVQRMVGIIPEPEVEVRSAVEALFERGLLTCGD